MMIEVSNVRFNEVTSDVASKTGKSNPAQQEKINQTDLEKKSVRQDRDSFEKTDDSSAVLYENYPNYSDGSSTELYEKYPNYFLTTGMPKSLFCYLDPLGRNMEDAIGNCMWDYYAGKIGQEEVQNFFEECCTSMRTYWTQKGRTSGDNAVDNQRIISEIYEKFAKKNALGAKNANWMEGAEINKQYGGRNDDWVYYNADYYYQCAETREFLQKITEDMVNKWEVPAIDYQEVEKNSALHFDGGFDFNSVWNFNFRNQRGRASIEDESLVPPADFKLFYKENFYSSGLNGWFSLQMDHKKCSMDIPFSSLPPEQWLRSQIFCLNELLENSIMKNTMKKYSSFLSHFALFTRAYSCQTRIDNIGGNYISPKS